MTLNQLQTEVAMLGFEKELEDINALVVSANRALRLIYMERPQTKTVCIFTATQKALSVYNTLVCKANESVSVKLDGACLSFTAVGACEYTITDKSGKRAGSTTGQFSTVREFINGGCTISFFSKHSFKICNLCSFEFTLSDSKDDIPLFTPTKSIDIENYCTDFCAFVGLPKDRLGRVVGCAELSSNKIILPWDFNDEIYIEYKRLPSKILQADTDMPIDIPEETSVLLPLLTASFLWLDDDADKAQYYMALYRDALASIRRYSTLTLDNTYCVNGWA